MTLQAKIVSIIFLYITNIGTVNAKNDYLTLQINAKVHYSDFIQVYYSYSPSNFNSKNQIKKIIKDGVMEKIIFQIPTKGSIPYLRIDWGGRALNSFEVESIELQLRSSNYKIKANSIGAYFNFNKYIEIVAISDSTFRFNSIRVKGKNPSWGLRFEKIANVLYHLEKIDTVFKSQIELESSIDDDGFIIVYYSDNDSDVPAFSYSNSVRIKDGNNTIFTENLIRHLRIIFYGSEGDTVIFKQVKFNSDLVNYELAGSEILSKFNLEGSKDIPKISKDELKFIMSNHPTSFVFGSKIKSKDEIIFSSLIVLFLLCSSIVLLFIFNSHFIKLS